jgi:hypothetical protein
VAVLVQEKTEAEMATIVVISGVVRLDKDSMEANEMIISRHPL